MPSELLGVLRVESNSHSPRWELEAPALRLGFSLRSTTDPVEEISECYSFWALLSMKRDLQYLFLSTSQSAYEICL